MLSINEDTLIRADAFRIAGDVITRVTPDGDGASLALVAENGSIEIDGTVRTGSGLDGAAEKGAGLIEAESGGSGGDLFLAAAGNHTSEPMIELPESGALYLGDGGDGGNATAYGKDRVALAGDGGHGGSLVIHSESRTHFHGVLDFGQGGHGGDATGSGQGTGRAIAGHGGDAGWYYDGNGPDRGDSILPRKPSGEGPGVNVGHGSGGTGCANYKPGGDGGDASDIGSPGSSGDRGSNGDDGNPLIGQSGGDGAAGTQGTDGSTAEAKDGGRGCPGGDGGYADARGGRGGHGGDGGSGEGGLGTVIGGKGGDGGTGAKGGSGGTAIGGNGGSAKSCTGEWGYGGDGGDANARGGRGGHGGDGGTGGSAALPGSGGLGGAGGTGGDPGSATAGSAGGPSNCSGSDGTTTTSSPMGSQGDPGSPGNPLVPGFSPSAEVFVGDWLDDDGALGYANRQDRAPIDAIFYDSGIRPRDSELGLDPQTLLSRSLCGLENAHTAWLVATVDHGGGDFWMRLFQDQRTGEVYVSWNAPDNIENGGVSISGSGYPSTGNWDYDFAGENGEPCGRIDSADSRFYFTYRFETPRWHFKGHGKASFICVEPYDEALCILERPDPDPCPPPPQKCQPYLNRPRAIED